MALNDKYKVVKNIYGLKVGDVLHVGRIEKDEEYLGECEEYEKLYLGDRDLNIDVGSITQERCFVKISN